MAYETVVINAITEMATSIAENAHDSIVENTDYGMQDNINKINWLLQNWKNFDNVNALSDAAFSYLDTSVATDLQALLQ